MRTLSLSNSDKVAIVSDEDWDKVQKHTWYVKKSAHKSYVATSVRVGCKVITVRLHRLVAELAGILLPWNMSDHVHHVNGDRYDCRRENLEALDPILHGEHHSGQA